jgi:hypothetical protein
VTPVDLCCGELAAGAGCLWVANGMDGTATNRFAGILRVGTVGRSHISPTVAARDVVWVTVGDAGAVLRVRP